MIKRTNNNTFKVGDIVKFGYGLADEPHARLVGVAEFDDSSSDDEIIIIADGRAFVHYSDASTHRDTLLGVA